MEALATPGTIWRAEAPLGSFLLLVCRRGWFFLPRAVPSKPFSRMVFTPFFPLILRDLTLELSRPLLSVLSDFLRSPSRGLFWPRAAPPARLCNLGLSPLSFLFFQKPFIFFFLSLVPQSFSFLTDEPPVDFCQPPFFFFFPYVGPLVRVVLQLLTPAALLSRGFGRDLGLFLFYAMWRPCTFHKPEPGSFVPASRTS